MRFSMVRTKERVEPSSAAICFLGAVLQSQLENHRVRLVQAGQRFFYQIGGDRGLFGRGTSPPQDVAFGILLALGVPFPCRQLFDVLENLVPRDRFQQAPQVNRRVDMELAQGVPAVKRAEGRLHYVFRVLFAAKTAIHLPFHQPAKPGTILLVQFIGIAPRYTSTSGVLGQLGHTAASDSNSSVTGTK